MIKKICLCVLILLFASVCLAQDQKMTPEQQQAMIQQQMNAMTPMFGQMMRVMMTAAFDVLSQPESAEKLASFTRNYYYYSATFFVHNHYDICYSLSQGV